MVNGAEGGDLEVPTICCCDELPEGLPEGGWICSSFEVRRVEKLDGGLPDLPAAGHGSDGFFLGVVLRYRFCDFRNDIDDSCGGAGAFSAAILRCGDAAGVCLFLVIDEEDAVDDGGLVCYGEVLEGVGDGGGDDVCVAGVSADEEAEGDDAADVSPS